MRNLVKQFRCSQWQRFPFHVAYTIFWNRGNSCFRCNNVIRVTFTYRHCFEQCAQFRYHHFTICCLTYLFPIFVVCQLCTSGETADQVHTTITELSLRFSWFLGGFSFYHCKHGLIIGIFSKHSAHRVDTIMCDESQPKSVILAHEKNDNEL